MLYDRREKKHIQRKWAKLVEHIAQEPMDVSQLPRKLTVYIAAPPSDGLLAARDHFHEYVKPILVSAALDWDAVEGRREGDVRAGLAERIRHLRKKKGEPSAEPIEEELEDLIEDTRTRAGVRPWDGIPGDIVIGRHTWKEYVRGLHEGWLGPLNPPSKPVEAPTVAVAEVGAEQVTSPQKSLANANPTPHDEASPSAQPEPEKPKEEETPKPEENKPKKKKQPPPFNTTADYNNSLVSPNCPQALGPTAVLPFPHLLGFLNFPIRMYRFLNRRQIADEIGRETAAAILAAYRPFESPGESRMMSDARSSNQSGEEGSGIWEQQRLLQHEESEWHKSVRERKDDNGKERVWLDDMVLDPRIAERMRKFVLDPEAEEKAARLASEHTESWWKSIWPKREVKKNLWEGLQEED